MKKSKKRIIFSVLILIVIIGIILIPLRKKKNQTPLQLVYGKITTGNVSNSITATGNLEPLLQVEVGTQVSGIIDKIYVDFNSHVKKGQLLAEMDKITLQSELTATEAELSAARVEFEYQEKAYKRNLKLHDDNLISDSEYDLSLYNYEKARSSYEKAKSNLNKVQRNLAYTQITSPIDGIVINREVEEGQTVASGFNTPTLFNIANDLTQMRVIADVDEADIGEVEEGQHVSFTVDAYPDDIFEGSVTQVRLEATNTSNVITYEVVIEAKNPDLKLKPGLTANVSIYTVEKNNVNIIPAKALRFNPQEDIVKRLGLKIQNNIVNPKSKKVWVKKDNILQAVEVKTGLTNGNNTEIISGLTENDEFVIELSSSPAGMPNMPEAGTASQEQSPFMPAGPGNRNKKNK